MGSRYWLVVILREDLEHDQFPTDRFGVWNGIRSVNGVEDVTDICAISEETLDAVLLPSACKRVFDSPGAWHWEHGPECPTPRSRPRKTAGVK